MVVIVMGVTASGKTTTGQRLAADLDWPFYDADSFHPPENIDRMTRGIPLTDADRAPWLRAIRGRIDQVLSGHGSAVIGCSALKTGYRRVLADGRVGRRYRDSREAPPTRWRGPDENRATARTSPRPRRASGIPCPWHSIARCARRAQSHRSRRSLGVPRRPDRATPRRERRPSAEAEPSSGSAIGPCGR